jgi:hypothetical protein
VRGNRAANITSGLNVSGNAANNHVTGNSMNVTTTAYSMSGSDGGNRWWNNAVIGTPATRFSLGTLAAGDSHDTEVGSRADPGSPLVGQQWLSSTTASTLKYYDGATTRSLVDLSLSQTLSNKTLSGPTLSGTVAGTPTWASAQTLPDVALTGRAFSTLGASPNGTQVYCSDCTIANPCASGGTGAMAKRLNSVWVCN